MKKAIGSWIFVFVFAFTLGLIVRDWNTSKLTAVHNTSAYAPTPEVILPESDEPTDTGAVNINTASKEELMRLNGIGEKMAQRIIDYRTEHGGFETVWDIMKVSGIGEAKFEAIKEDITVTPD